MAIRDGDKESDGDAAKAVTEQFVGLSAEQQLSVVRAVLPRLFDRLDRRQLLSMLRNLLEGIGGVLQGRHEERADRQVTPTRPSRRRVDAHAGQSLAKTRLLLRGIAADARTDEAATRRLFTAVMCTLGHRITDGERDHLLSQLPRALQQLGRCEQHASRLRLRPRDIDLAEFRELVVEHLPAEERQEIVPKIRAVFRAIHRHVSEGEADDVASQLPHALRDLWMEHHPL